MLVATRHALGISLKDAVRRASTLGVLANAHGQRQRTSPSVDAAAAASLPQPAPSDGTGGHAHWARVEQRQRDLYTAQRTLAQPGAVAIPRSWNLIHVEGIVSEVECGYALHHQEGASSAVRHVVSVTDAVGAHAPLLQLWLDVPEGGRGVPLAVRCYLSDEAVDWVWRSRTTSTEQEERGHIHDKVESYMRWARKKLRHQRVIVSGILKEELLYDAEVDDVVVVPVVRLPKDGLGASVHIVA